MKNRLKQKGFTLVEIIIVVVILAILAALILPRFLNQPENAAISEGQEMLGALRRAQITTNDTTNAYVALGCTNAACTAPAAAVTALGQLGIQIPAGNTRFIYTCNAGATPAGALTPASAGVCSAARQATADRPAAAAGATITLGLDDGRFACGTYQTRANNRGCSF